MTIEANVSEQDDIDNASALSNSLAILTLVTGEEWTKQKLLDTNLALKNAAKKTLSDQGLTRSDAATLVDNRWAEYESHESVAPPPQEGFRSAFVSEQPAPLAETMVPLVAPTREEVVAKAASRIEEWKARRAEEKAAQEEAAPPVEDAAPDEQI